MNFNLQFTQLTNTRVWFANVGAFNNFISSITVAIPNAGENTLGLVKQADIALYTPAVVNAPYINLSSDENTPATQVPNMVAFASLQAKVDAMGVYIETLTEALQTSGVITGS